MKKKVLNILLFSICATLQAHADVRLPRLISDGMVLQRNAKVNIWGWADPGEMVHIKFLQHKLQAKADQQGNWKIILPALKAGGPFTMQIKGNNEIELNNILVGDVWLCAGQSNMVTPMERVKEKYPKDIANSTNNLIRMITVPVKTDFNNPATNITSGKWEAANPKTLLQFSAVGYFFARKLNEKYKVPIGIINSSVGGPPVEAWLSEEALKEFPALEKKLLPFKNNNYVDSIQQAENQKQRSWNDNVNANDLGLKDVKWYDPAYEPKDWLTMNVPGYWNNEGLKTNGVVWFRKEIDLPQSAAGKPAKLFLGRIIDADFTYVNGKQVGNITYQYPPRRYEIPEGVLKAGKNIITVRIINSNGQGGLAVDKPYYLQIGKDSIDLKGSWQYKPGYSSPPMRGGGINTLYQPSGIYNCMIAPLINYTIKGANWYQGEGNAGNPGGYHEQLSAMIKDWRKKWGQGNFPFQIVQLPNFGEAPKQPGESNWARLREQQLKTLNQPNTTIVVTIDIGEWNDLHPLNKKDVGERLALAARKLAYGESTLVASGPIYKSMKIEGNKLVISFDNTGSGLVNRDKTDLKGFAIAGEDQQFVWAKAKINGNKVVVWSDEITQPVAVRYAWADNPQPATLYNKEGLPASPFRTDNFGLTGATPWRNKECIVVLTYDDALNDHLDFVIPALDSVGLKATFYLSSFTGVLEKRVNEWKLAAQHGHELGNHTINHPCVGGKPGREWVAPAMDLRNYTVDRMIKEVQATNTLLKSIDGKSERTFAYPCGDTKIGDTTYLAPIYHEFSGARGVRYDLKLPFQTDRYDIGCFGVNGQSGEVLIEEVKKAMSSHKLLVFMFHGVGSNYSLTVSLEAHRQLLQFLKQEQSKIWIGTMTEVSEYIRQNQEKK